VVTQKVILYYGFTPLADPQAVLMWQRELAANLGLKGRVLFSHHGINGTLGGDIDSLKRYISATKKFEGFRNIDFKWSDATGTEFPKLQMRVREEIVSFGAPDELYVSDRGVVGGGKHLSPVAVNHMVAQRDDVVFFEGRNAFEAKIGRFKNAIVPDVETTRDFVAEIESGKYDHLKKRPVITYCTGGIRCEVLSSVMINRGFEEVYQVKGGIVRYAETFGDKGLWEGSLYVFDARMRMEFSDETAVIGHCEQCDAATSDFVDRQTARGRRLVLLCADCTKLDATELSVSK